LSESFLKSIWAEEFLIPTGSCINSRLFSGMVFSLLNINKSAAKAIKARKIIIALDFWILFILLELYHFIFYFPSSLTPVQQANEENAGLSLTPKSPKSDFGEGKNAV